MTLNLQITSERTNTYDAATPHPGPGVTFGGLGVLVCFLVQFSVVYFQCRRQNSHFVDKSDHVISLLKISQ